MTIRSLIALLSFSIAPVSLVAQAPAAHEIALDYTYLHTNAPPGGCGCFSMNGGSGSYAYHFNPKFSLVAGIEAVHASKVDAGGDDLTLTSFLAGPRYHYRRHARWVPYGQILLGAVHGTGTLATATFAKSSSTTFGAVVGGGVEYNINPTFALRLVEANYYVTTFDNNVNDHQNNLRLTSGLLVRLGRK